MPTNAVHTSVPPLIDVTCTRSPTASRTQRNPSAGRGRARRPDGAQRDEVELTTGHEARLMACHEERRARPEHVDALVGREPPERREIGVPRVTVVEHDRRTDEQPRHEVVPHHPPGRGEPHEPVARSEILAGSASTFRCSAVIPPCPCTIALGRPVVPEEYRT